MMELQTGMFVLLLLAAVFPSAEALHLYDPQLCYILDGFLGLYGLIITGMFIKEKFFRVKGSSSDDLGQAGYPPLMRGDPERGGRNRRQADDNSTYTGLTRRTDDEYKELPVKRERQRKNEQVYQGLSATRERETYDSLQMQPLPPR